MTREEHLDWCKKRALERDREQLRIPVDDPHDPLPDTVPQPVQPIEQENGT